MIDRLLQSRIVVQDLLDDVGPQALRVQCLILKLKVDRRVFDSTALDMSR